MTIQKFLHSCLLVAVGDKKLLIDPGAFCFVEGLLQPEDIGPVDVILLTHEHPDHFFPDAIRRLLALRSARIATHPELAEKVRAAGFACEIVADGATMSVAGFEITSVPAAHGVLPIPVPPNVGFIIKPRFYGLDHRTEGRGAPVLFHPGDSLDFVLPAPPDVLALPVAGPWLTVSQAVDAAIRLKPKTVIPIHDAIIKDFMLERIYQNMLAPSLQAHEISFKPLGLGRSLDV